MSPRSIALALAALLLSPACGRRAEEAPPPAPAPQVAAADTTGYIARGNEPFWAVTVSAEGIRFSEPDNIEGTLAPYRAPVLAESSLVFNTVLADSVRTPLELVLEERQCIDSMSGFEYPYTATARVGGRVLQGCGERRDAAANRPRP
jgi:uncharacterized membrane protein